MRSRGAFAFGGLLVGAAVLRAYAMGVHGPAVLNENVHDGAGYIRGANLGLGVSAQQPSGYPLFLRFVHALSDELAVTIGVQHALGIAGGVLLFIVVRRLGAPWWLSLAPAVAVWFNGDQVFLEHGPLSESLFSLILAATLYAAVRCLDGGGPGWPLAAGALAAGLLTIRSVATPVAAIVVVWLVLALWRGRLPWLRPAALAFAAAVAVVAGYAALRHQVTGRFSLVANPVAWTWYSRAAEFADCRRFSPPPGTRVLCETTPPDRRPGPGWYLYIGGPAIRAFGGPGRHDHLVGAFARAAILHQPLDYVEVSGTDVVRYVHPGAGPLRYSDFAGPESVAFRAGRPRVDADALREASAYYAPFRLDRAHQRRLHAYQRVFRVSGALLLGLLAVGSAGALVAGWRVRWGILLLLAVALELLLFPALTHAEWRYAVPTAGPLAAAGVLGGWALARRGRSLWKTPTPP